MLIGGTGERRTLRLVAEYGDACNLFDVPDGGAAIRRQLDVLDRHCTDIGRLPSIPGTGFDQIRAGVDVRSTRSSTFK